MGEEKREIEIKHSQELSEEYPGKEIYITYMPTDEETVTLL